METPQLLHDAGDRDSSWAPRLAIALVALFLIEPLAAKSHIAASVISTPVHIALTAVVSCLVVGAALFFAPRRRQPVIGLLFSALFCLALLGSVFSDRFATFNTVFAVVWIVHFLAIWWGVPRLMAHQAFDSQTGLLLLILAASVLLSVVFFEQSSHARGEGFFVNATHLGRISVLAAVCAFWHWLGGRRRSWLAVPVLGLALALLVVSRTRASIGAALIGLGVVFVAQVVAGRTGPRNRSLVVISGTLLAVLGFLYLLDYGMLTTDGYVEYFRLTGGVAGVFGSRVRIWESGLDRLADAGLIGGGFSEKFAGEVAVKWGIEYPTYDWRELVDPHNMLLTTAIQLGIPAMIVLAALLIAIAVGVHRVDPDRRSLALGVFYLGLVFGLADGNWFITFSPVDRISMTLLALALSRPRAGPIEAVPDRPEPPQAPTRIATRTEDDDWGALG